jgi:DNA gyrase/topoisomerase IV subunit B
VATGLHSELTRLGYEVTDLGAGEHLATRGQTVVRVKIHDRPAVSVGVDGRGFPTAPPDGVVVELTVA